MKKITNIAWLIATLFLCPIAICAMDQDDDDNDSSSVGPAAKRPRLSSPTSDLFSFNDEQYGLLRASNFNDYNGHQASSALATAITTTAVAAMHTMNNNQYICPPHTAGSIIVNADIALQRAQLATNNNNNNPAPLPALDESIETTISYVCPLCPNNYHSIPPVPPDITTWVALVCHMRAQHKNGDNDNHQESPTSAQYVCQDRLLSGATCGAVFSSQFELRAHRKNGHSYDIRVHDYKCSQCPNSYQYYGNLKRHMLEQHRIKLPDYQEYVATSNNNSAPVVLQATPVPHDLLQRINFDSPHRCPLCADKNQGKPKAPKDYGTWTTLITHMLSQHDIILPLKSHAKLTVMSANNNNHS